MPQNGGLDLSEADQTALIDEAIMSAVRSKWLKVAMIGGRAAKALEGRVQVDLTMTEQGEAEVRDVLLDAIAARIQVLVEHGKLVGAGDLLNWRHGEVRLPPDAQ
jgi:hypothetical protein